MLDPVGTAGPAGNDSGDDRKLRLGDGCVADVVAGALELRDAEGRLLLRYHDGSAELVAPAGDLRLAAPAGKIRLESATDVELCPARDLVQRPGRRARVEVADSRLEVDAKRVQARSPSLEVTTQQGRITVGRATVLARHVCTRAERIATEVERYEITAERIVERSRDTFREVGDLLQEKAGRIRTVVVGLRALYSERTVMVSKKDTSIDGDKVLLG